MLHKLRYASDKQKKKKQGNPAENIQETRKLLFFFNALTNFSRAAEAHP